MCFAVWLILMTALLLSLPVKADERSLFHQWFEMPQDKGVPDNYAKQLEQTLQDFILTHRTKAINIFLNTSAGHEAGILAGIVSRASRIVEASDKEIDTLLSSTNALLSYLPGSYDGWPLARRVLLASFMLRYAKHRPFDSTASAATVQSILLKMYEQLKASAKQKGLIEFMHVSKSGGSSFCQLAKANGCSSEDFGWNNCLIMDFNDGPRYFDAEVHAQLRGDEKTRCDRGFKLMRPRTDLPDCADRRQWLREQGFTMYANEYTAFGGGEDPSLAHPCRNMLTVLEIRQPFSRVISHLKHAWFNYAMYCGDHRDAYFAGGHNTSTWAALMPAATNNYIIRSLLGEAVFNLPLGAITRAHLDLARQLMAEQYDVLLVLEDQQGLARAMRYGLGWGVQEKHANARGKTRDTNLGLPEDPERLMALNDLDTELYNFGLVLARLDGIMYAAAAALPEEFGSGGGSSSGGSGGGGGGGGGAMEPDTATAVGEGGGAPGTGEEGLAAPAAAAVGSVLAAGPAGDDGLTLPTAAETGPAVAAAGSAVAGPATAAEAEPALELAAATGSAAEVEPAAEMSAAEATVAALEAAADMMRRRFTLRRWLRGLTASSSSSSSGGGGGSVRSKGTPSSESEGDLNSGKQATHGSVTAAGHRHAHHHRAPPAGHRHGGGGGGGSAKGKSGTKPHGHLTAPSAATGMTSAEGGGGGEGDGGIIETVEALGGAADLPSCGWVGLP